MFPSGSDGVTLQTAEGDWEMGSLTEIVPEDGIDKDFVITELVVEQCNRPNKVHEIVLLCGEKEIARRRFCIKSTASGEHRIDINSKTIRADSAIHAMLAVQGIGSEITIVSLQYKRGA